MIFSKIELFIDVSSMFSFLIGGVSGNFVVELLCSVGKSVFLEIGVVSVLALESTSSFTKSDFQLKPRDRLGNFA